MVTILQPWTSYAICAAWSLFAMISDHASATGSFLIPFKSSLFMMRTYFEPMIKVWVAISPDYGRFVGSKISSFQRVKKMWDV